tara:strand:- start:155 stop:355 length:201 start_codon:yes stop_codon:yes gene_type:complete
VQKDQEDLVMLEVSHHQKEIMVEVEETLTTEVVVPVVVLQQLEQMDLDIQDQPEEMEHQIQLQDQM